MVGLRFTHGTSSRKWKVGRGHLLREVAAIEPPSASPELRMRLLSTDIMEHCARSSLRATRSHVLRQAARKHGRTFTSIPPFPPTCNTTPQKPPSSALPMPFVTETVGGGWHTCRKNQHLSVDHRADCLLGRRHLLPPPQRTNHLPQRRSRRNQLSLHRRPTPLPRSRESLQTNFPLHQLPRRLRHCRSCYLRHHAIYSITRLYNMLRASGIDGKSTTLRWSERKEILFAA